MLEKSNRKRLSGMDQGIVNCMLQAKKDKHQEENLEWFILKKKMRFGEDHAACT